MQEMQICVLVFTLSSTRYCSETCWQDHKREPCEKREECKVCRQLTSKRCMGCESIVHFYLHECWFFSYCTHGCQKKDWKKHKQECGKKDWVKKVMCVNQPYSVRSEDYVNKRTMGTSLHEFIALLSYKNILKHLW